MAIYPVILAGGSGTRLWPLSRHNHPKQYLDVLDSAETLFQSTIKRAAHCSTLNPIVVAQADHRFLLQHQLDAISFNSANVLLEPSGRNTLGAVALGCLAVLSQDPDAMMLVLPADHYLPDTQGFAEAVQVLRQQLDSDSIGLFGIQPSFAATQYGYMRFQQGDAACSVEQFLEKPDHETASQLIQCQDVAWNSGMVLASAKAIYSALAAYCPSELAVIEAAYEQSYQQYGFTFIADAYSNVSSVSFDVAVLEKHQGLKMQCLPLEWDDLGSWQSLVKRREQLNHPSKNVFSSGKTMLVFTDDELVLVDDDDVLMLAHQDQLLDMAKITNYLHAHNLTSLLNRIDVHRPWGCFKVLAQSQYYVVKQLQVYPHCQISLQSHANRQEHWVVVKGEAQVQLDDEVFSLVEGQAVSVGRHQKHRLRNASDTMLEIIEVQSGPVLDELDIVRYDDEYNRHLKNKH